jgi:RNA-directed DNA polymerase
MRIVWVGVSIFRGQYLNIVPSAKAMNRVRERLRHLTARKANLPQEEVVTQVNRFLKGWSNYFCFGYPRMAFRKVNWYVQTRLRRFLLTRSQRRCRHLEGPSLYQGLRAKGLVYL